MASYGQRQVVRLTWFLKQAGFAAALLVAVACAGTLDKPSASPDASASDGGGRGPGFDGASFAPPASGYAEMNIYPGDPPNFLATAPPESVDPTIGAIRSVSVPTLRRYPVDESKSSGVAFLAFPGGGYTLLDMERQATALAARLGPMGISVFGLKSRVGDGSSNPRRDALLDAQRALRMLRSHAEAWHLDANRIGTVSWSAGSHLALMLAGQFDSGQPTSDDPVCRFSRSLTACLSRMFVMGGTRFLGLGDTLIGTGTVA